MCKELLAINICEKKLLWYIMLCIVSSFVMKLLQPLPLNQGQFVNIEQAFYEA